MSALDVGLLRFGQKEESWTCLKRGGFSWHVRDLRSPNLLNFGTWEKGRHGGICKSSSFFLDAALNSLEVTGAAAEPLVLREGCGQIN